MKQIFSYHVLIPLAVVLAVVPFGSPHLAEKSRMLSQGVLVRPLDILDLIWHSWPLVLLGIRVGRDIGRRLTG